MDFSIRVPVAFMGGLIGYKGETIQSFQKETGCDARIAPKEKTDLRKVTLLGQVDKGIERMFEIFTAQLQQAEKGALSKMEKDQDFTFKAEVAPNQVGAVIGKQGKNAELLRQKSNCTVKIQVHGEIVCTGKIEDIGHAMINIWNQVKQTPSRPIPPPTTTGPEIEVTLMIPSESVGVIIGKRGENITQIRRHCSSVKIEISREEGDDRKTDSLRKVTLRGNMGSTAVCHHMLASYLA